MIIRTATTHPRVLNVILCGLLEIATGGPPAQPASLFSHPGKSSSALNLPSEPTVAATGTAPYGSLSHRNLSSQISGSIGMIFSVWPYGCGHGSGDTAHFYSGDDIGCGSLCQRWRHTWSPRACRL